MLSGDRSIELTFHYFYIVFDYSSFLELQLNPYKISLFSQFFIHQLLFFLVPNISFKIFVQAFFCWLLNCVHHIYWVSIHWSWNLSSCVVVNFQWYVSKPYIRICSPHTFVEGCVEGDGFYGRICCHQYIDWLQGSSSSLQLLVNCWQLIYKYHRRLFLLLSF